MNYKAGEEREGEERSGQVTSDLCNDAINKIKKLYIVSIFFHLFGLIIRFGGIWEEKEAKSKHWISYALY